MNHFLLNDLVKNNAGSDIGYFEFLDVASLRSGIYSLKKGSMDPQSPHLEDEVYIVMQGTAKIQIGNLVFPANQGDMIYVPAKQEHRFFDIKEDLNVLVIFSKVRVN
jgi:mannose-6-phosphate isomerase-like protein (cupin superfamily)